MAYDYSLTINVDQDSLAKMNASNIKLFAFRSVETNSSGGAPLVWQRGDLVYKQQVIGWNVNYGAFFTDEKISGNANYSGISNYPIKLGQVLSIDNTGTGEITDEGTNGTVSVLNNSKRDFSCGVSQEDTNGDLSPICAFPLLTSFIDLMIPIEKVALIFASDTSKTSTVYYRARGPGILVDLTSPTAKNRVLNYSLSDGWVADKLGTSNLFDANTDMSKMLIEISVNLVRAAEKLMA